jgi:hypothetical protein
MPDADVQSFTTFDGEELILANQEGDSLFAISYGNYGMPPVEYLIRRGYKQDGSTVVDYTVNDRSIMLTFYQVTACTREQYWQYRAALIDFFRPNRGGALTLTVREAGGNKRALKVYAAPGFVFAPTAPDESGFVLQEPLTFVAYDPIWYDPTTASVVVTGTSGSQLVFPITFPIVFDPDGVVFSTTINYVGNWNSYPIVTINGPYTSATIRNVSTGVNVVLFIAIGVGEQRVIDFTPGSQSVTDGMGVDKFGDLSPSPNSNLVDFNIRPDPLVPNGANSFEITLTGGAIGTSSVTIAYNARYVGI